MSGVVVGVAKGASHRFAKPAVGSIDLLQGLGVEGDAHCGATVKHRWSARKRPATPNLRQVHLIDVELLEELSGLGFALEAGELGENILVRGMALTRLRVGARLAIGPNAIVEATGLREPCGLIDKFRPGLRAACTVQNDNGAYLKGGLMAIVVRSGAVQRGDLVRVIETSSNQPPLAIV
jgi:MOSC domain-containing protein YiiM